MWNEFNIKTFPAETIVFRDGVYCPELSTLENKPINKKYRRPVHVIYVGDIDGEKNLDIAVGVQNQIVIVSVNVKIKKSAFLNIFIKNAGEFSKIQGTVLIENNGNLEYKCKTRHLCENTAILIKSKVLARKNSNTKMTGGAIIDKNSKNCESDIALTAMAEKDAKIEFLPEQQIKSEPIRADHSASIYKPTQAQITFLRQAGLGTFEVDDVLKEAFLS